ncbi:hypothetical protein LOK49_LG07G03149 [Camellia lanceoleosa]|uniref:Uncharacterized protein n=1 Tax=Camellia lanceoleosa TaxID=1840588 RepID=A0ACC0H4P8_9ERIC|nr:hypothetical protein LOK49_LG07G03149 [Camellia lanceoleosa]
MSSSSATMAASRMMMSYTKASLHHLIRRHLRPTTTAAAANAPGSLRPLSEFMRFFILQDFAASEVRLGCGVAPIRVGFAFGLEAERLNDESRVEVRGGPIKIDDEVNYSDADYPPNKNSDADDDDDDDEENDDFDAADYPSYEHDSDAKFYKNHHTNADHGGHRNWKPAGG